MKIGILTFHRAHNYGAMLQAYALKHILQGKGHHVEFISYRQPKIESAYKAFICNISKSNGIIGNVKNVLSAVITLNRRMERRRRFVQFMEKNLPESKKYTKEELAAVILDYDAVFFGSDQIWTTRFMGGFDDIYWGGVHLKEGKKIAYAPSMELKSVSEAERTYIKKHITNFDSVSARETHMSELLESITGISIPTVADPTLLCTKNDYTPLILASKNVPKEPYVLVYQVGHHAMVDEIAQKVANQLHCRIIEIGSEVLLHHANTYKDGYGPEDFVALIAHATFVVSCSFHGTAFSVNFHKPFYSVLIRGLDSRATSFLSQVGLIQCGIRSIEEVDAPSMLGIDFLTVDDNLQRMRCKSIDYINNALA